MARPGFWGLVALAGASQASAALESLSSLRSIDRVPESLKALLSGLEEESTARNAVASEQRKWCEDTLRQKKDAVDDAQEAGEEHTADLRDAESRRDTARQRADDIKQQIRNADGELSELEKEFDEKKAEYKKNVDDLQKATGDVEQSVFTQHSVRKERNPDLAKLRSLDSALLRDSAPPSFLQLKRAVDDQVDSAKDMEEAEAELRAEWGEEQTRMGDLMKDKKRQVGDLEGALENAQLAVAEAEEKAASLTRSKNAAERTGSREAKLVTTLDATCASQKAFFADQDKLRLEAAAGIEEALDMLQTLSHTALTQFVGPSFVQLEPALLDLTAAADAQSALAASDGLDPLAEIKAKIQGMVQALEAAANAETGPATFCSDEQAKNREKKRTKTDDIDRLAAEARRKGFELDGVVGAQRSAQSSLNKLSVLKAHLDSFSTVEQSRLANMKKDHDLAVEVLDKAASLVKSEFGLTLLQVNPLSPQEMAGRAVSAMSTANEKIRDLSSAADGYLSKLEAGGQEELVEVQRAMRSEEQQFAEAKSEEATKRDEIAQAQTSEQNARAELTVIVTYLSNLGQQCGPQLGNSYEELKRQREEEIQALQDAVKVLDGESVPALSMAQVKNPTAVQRAAMALGVA